MNKNILIIGLGGIGASLCDNLLRFINSLDEDYDVALIDGDDYNVNNFDRQSYIFSDNKAKSKYTELTNRFKRINMTYIPEYITTDNISTLIKSEDIIFLCVDNHDTRKLVSDYVNTLPGITLFSGGNEYTDGNVQVFQRKGGKKISPSLTDYHPEIDNPSDKSPHKMSCEELSISEPQLLFTNLGVATIMCWLFYNVIIRKQTVSGEVYFDILQMAASFRERSITKKKREDF